VLGWIYQSEKNQSQHEIEAVTIKSLTRMPRDMDEPEKGIEALTTTVTDIRVPSAKGFDSRSSREKHVDNNQGVSAGHKEQKKENKKQHSESV
jgi:hypothetical protein